MVYQNLNHGRLIGFFFKIFPPNLLLIIIIIFQGRRLSLDYEDISPMLTIENQENDYTKRRNTADNENVKTRERNFIKRQIVLGNIEVGESSAEDMTLSMISGKHSSEDLSKSINDISETIFKMDSLDLENIKADDAKSVTVLGTPLPLKSTEDSVGDSKSSKKRRKRVKRKNAPRKSTSVNQLTISQTSDTLDNNDTNTDRSSLESHSSEVDLKEYVKQNFWRYHSVCVVFFSKLLLKNETDPDDTSNIKRIDADFHFFSDTELTTNSNGDMRSGSPINIESVQSDSEIEVKIRKGNITTTHQILDGNNSIIFFYR